MLPNDMLITLMELLDMVITILLVGYIFSDLVAVRESKTKKPWETKVIGFIDYDALKFSIIVTAPAIIFHELAHKFMALSFNLSATYNAAYTWLAIGVILKLVGFPFIFFVPAYVMTIGTPTYMQQALISFAGPLLNLILWLGAWAILSTKRKLGKRSLLILTLTKQINMWLFIFNMLPIPMFDGWGVYSNIYHVLA